MPAHWQALGRISYSNHLFESTTISSSNLFLRDGPTVEDQASCSLDFGWAESNDDPLSPCAVAAFIAAACSGGGEPGSIDNIDHLTLESFLVHSVEYPTA